MTRPMTGARFSNTIALFTAANGIFVAVAMFAIISLGWPWWVCSIVMFLAVMVGGTWFSSWLYWETTQTAFDALRATQRQMAEREEHGHDQV